MSNPCKKHQFYTRTEYITFKILQCKVCGELRTVYQKEEKQANGNSTVAAPGRGSK